MSVAPPATAERPAPGRSRRRRPLLGPATDPGELRTRGGRASVRRGLGLLAMTVLLPGSAQLVTGHRGVGLVALRTWGLLWAVLLGFGVLALVNRDAAVAVLAAGFTWSALQALLVLLGVAWVLLLLDAWRLARPIDMPRSHRLGFAALSLGLAFTVASGAVASAGAVDSQGRLVAHVFAGGGESEEQAGRYNVLLLGADAGASRVGLRPDSIHVASIDAVTGRSVLFSLPRNMEDIPFPESSPLHELYPAGYTCPEHACLLNSVYTEAMNHPDLYPGVRDPGAQATKEAVEGITGLSINYYAMVDMVGFESLVDAVGGITLDIGAPVPIGGGSSPISGYIEPGVGVTLDGHHALWFARSREGSSDFERMQRQRCVMSAMLDQLDPVTVATRFTEIAGAGQQVVTTDVPGGDVNQLVELALRTRELPLQSVSFTPPLVYPGSPDFALIRASVAHHVEAAELLDEGVEPGPAPQSVQQESEAAERAAEQQAEQAEQQRPVEERSGGTGAEPPAGVESTATPETSAGASAAEEPPAAEETGDDTSADDLVSVCRVS